MEGEEGRIKVSLRSSLTGSSWEVILTGITHAGKETHWAMAANVLQYHEFPLLPWNHAQARQEGVQEKDVDGEGKMMGSILPCPSPHFYLSLSPLKCLSRHPTLHPPTRHSSLIPLPPSLPSTTLPSLISPVLTAPSPPGWLLPCTPPGTTATRSTRGMGRP